MKTIRMIGLSACVGVALVGGLWALKGQDPGEGGMPALPAEPSASPVELVYAQPFTLDEPYVHHYRSEQPLITGGYLVVLKVADKDLLAPRQTAQPVLYAGEQTVERVNVGHVSGHVVGIVPTAGELDLDATLFFFGDADLPERLDAKAIRAQVEKARARGVTPPSPQQAAEALRDARAFHAFYDLHYFAADLIEVYAQDEADVVSGLRAPLIGG